ncbi:MAG: hypothetical protein H6754_06895 [Candidatus Omnitrophica bacterium]|nr:hypothetical protein [Candidatus Omnitrophota bacterium]
MHEKKKLKEAKYFYKRMQEGKDKPEYFINDLSAFLSSARSVLQYACEEAKQKSGGQQWYDTFMSNSDILRFFKGKRDINIHAEPVNPKVQHNVTISETIHLSESWVIQSVDKKGNVISESRSEDKDKTKYEVEPTSVSTDTTYKFDDWNGEEDILQLGQKYVQILEGFISDGISKGFICG